MNDSFDAQILALLDETAATKRPPNTAPSSGW
jgi:hypothetical protein